jgi:hypothetical protein
LTARLIGDEYTAALIHEARGLRSLQYLGNLTGDAESFRVSMDGAVGKMVWFAANEELIRTLARRAKKCHRDHFGSVIKNQTSARDRRFAP